MNSQADRFDLSGFEILSGASPQHECRFRTFASGVTMFVFRKGEIAITTKEGSITFLPDAPSTEAVNLLVQYLELWKEPNGDNATELGGVLAEVELTVPVEEGGIRELPPQELVVHEVERRRLAEPVGVHFVTCIQEPIS